MWQCSLCAYKDGVDVDGALCVHIMPGACVRACASVPAAFTGAGASTAKRAGWIAFHAQATATDPKGGVAILVRADSDSPHVTIVAPPPLFGASMVDC